MIFSGESMNQANIDKLVNEVLAIEQEEAEKAGTIGYMTRALIQATLPHSKVDGHEFKRRNGDFKLTILADSDIGLPYGSIPRLLMAWITTEAVKTKQRELILGRTLSGFMAELGMIPSGGRWGSITRLKDQMKRLFSAAISCTYESESNWGIRNVVPVEKAELWWNPKTPDQAGLWESKLLLGETFFKEVIESPVPIDMRALTALRQSPMALDIYCWLTYRLSYLRKATQIPWGVLQVQFGADYKDLRQFKRRFLNQLERVLFVYPEARVEYKTSSLILLPSRSHVSKQVKANNVIKPIINQKDQNIDKKSVQEIDKILEEKYLEYRLNTIVEIIETLSDEKERHLLFKEFDEHLLRKGLAEIRMNIVKGNHTNTVKEELYRFVNNNWHHLLDGLKSYSDFCKTISK